MPVIVHFRLVRIVALLLLLTVAHNAVAAEPSTIDYQVLYRALEAARGIERFPRLKAVQRVESKLAGVPPTAIRITVLAAAGKIAVPIAADGAMAFPLRDDLLAENPAVESNQPRGSLTLTLSIELALPASARIAAQDIEAALAEVDSLFATRATEGRPHARGVEFYFLPGTGSVTLRGASERLLTPDASGRVIVMRDSDLAEGVTEVELGASPRQVLPFFNTPNP